MALNVKDFAAQKTKVEEDDNIMGITYKPEAEDSKPPCIDFEMDEARIMESMGLPTTFTVPDQVQKSEKKTSSSFVCDICQVTVTSEDTMMSHLKGAKHLKNASRSNQVEATVREIPTIKSSRKVASVRLAEKLRETTQALVGLHHVTETVACSNAEMEPYYHCGLCGSKGEANGMYHHLLGKGHREKFLHSLHPTSYLSLNPAEVNRKVEMYRENDNLEDSIVTVHSDELYPWPPGKAPWSVEQGGTGMTPTNSRNSIYSYGSGRSRLKSFADLETLDLPPVQNSRQLEKYYTLALALAAKGSSYHVENVARHEDAETIDTLHTMVKTNLTLMRHILSNDVVDKQHEDVKPKRSRSRSEERSRSKSRSPHRRKERHFRR